MENILDKTIEQEKYVPNDWNIIMTKKDNGFIIKYSGSDYEFEKVYEQKEDDAEESFEHYIKIFYDIMEYFGDFPSKHRKNNINIKYKSEHE
jgi:hypothetical protein